MVQALVKLWRSWSVFGATRGKVALNHGERRRIHTALR